MTPAERDYFENLPDEKKKQIVTGNWGCGCFNGSPELKFIIQWLAASQSGREMVYTTFKLPKFTQKMTEFMQTVQGVQVGQIASILLSLEEVEKKY